MSAVFGSLTISRILPATNAAAVAFAARSMAVSMKAPPMAKPPRFQRDSNTRRRSSSLTAKADCSVGSTATIPAPDSRAF